MPNQRNANRLKQKTTKGLAAWDFRSDKSKARLNDKPEKTPEVMGEENPMAAFDNIPRETQIMGQPHMLSYINPQEEAMLQKMRGGMPPVAGPGGVPAFAFSWSDIFGGGSSTTTDTSDEKDDDEPGFFDSGGAFETWVDTNIYDFDGDQSGAAVSNDNDNSYIVSSNDTLSQIASDNNMSVAEIMDANPDITNPDQIGIGQTLDLSGAGSGSSTYADGVGLGGIGSEPDVVTTTPIFTSGGLEIRSLDSGTQYYVDEAGDFVGLVTDPDEFDPRGDQIISPTSNGAGVVTPATGYDDLDGVLTNLNDRGETEEEELLRKLSEAFGPKEGQYIYNKENLEGQEDDTDFSLTSGDSRDDLSFDLTDPSEPLATGNGVNFTGTYEGVTYVDGYPETAPLQVTIDESTYVPGQDTFESTFLANYGVPVPTTESAFMALPDGAKTDLALLPKDDMEDLLQTISTTSGDNSNVATTLINFGADLIGVRGVGDDPLYGVELTDNPANLLPPETETTPLNVELISTEDYEKLTNSETDNSVVGGYDEAGLNVGGGVGATDDDLATDFSAFDTTGTDSSVVGGYDEAGLNAFDAIPSTATEVDSETTKDPEIQINSPDLPVYTVTSPDGEILTFTDMDEYEKVVRSIIDGTYGETGNGDVEIVFNDDGSAGTGDGGEFDDVQGAVNGALDGNGTDTGGDGSGDGEGSGSGTGDGSGDGSGQEEIVDEPEVIEPEDVYKVDQNFAVRDLMADFQRRRKGGTGYGLPQYMQRYMSGEIIDELVRVVELADGTILYQTPDGRYLDPEEFIGTAELGDAQSIKIGDEEYQTGYTTTNLNTGQAVRYDMSGNPIIT
jgi:LysM repeat protein